MNKNTRHPLSVLSRILLAAMMVSLALGPAFASATVSGPDCKMPCCIPYTAKTDSPHDGMTGSMMPPMTSDGCPSSTGAPCDLSEAPLAARTLAVLQASPVAYLLDAPGSVPAVSVDDALPMKASSLFQTTALPSAFPPLFLTHSTFLS